MADETIKIGIVVDDSGAEQKLLGIAAAEQKVADTATQKLDPALTELQKIVKSLDSGFREAKASADGLQDALEKKAAPAAKKATTELDFLQKSILRFVSAAAVGAAIKSSVDFAGKIQDMADKTKLSTGFLQELSGAAATSGVSVDQVARAALNLTKNIGNGNEALSGAVSALGISFETIKTMKPEDQFMVLARAVAGVKDPIEQTRLGFAIFGRDWQSIASAVTQETLEMMNATRIMKDSTVKWLDELGDAWVQMKRNFVVQVGEMLSTGQGLAILGGPLLQAAVDKVNLLRIALNGVGDLPGLPGAPGASINPGAGPVGPVGDDPLVSFIENKLNRIKSETDKFARGVEAEAKKAAAAQAQWVASISSPWAWNATGSATNASFPTLPNISGQNVSGLPGTLPSTNPWGGQGFTGLPGGPNTASRGGLVNSAFGSSGFQNIVGGLPSAILGAFQGGGNVGASIGSSLGGSLGSELVGSIGKTVTSTLGNTLGGALNAVIPGLGGLLGGLAGKLFGKLFGPSQEELTQKMREQWEGSVEDMDALKKAANLAGVSLDKLYNAKKVKDFEKAQRDLNAEMKEYEKVLQGLSTAAEGLNTRVTAFATPMLKAWQDNEDATKKFTAAQDALNVAIVNKDPAGIIAAKKALDDALTVSEKMKTSLAEATAGGEDGFKRMGNMAFATFAATLQYTGDLFGALDAIGPALDTLIDLQDKFGFESNEAVTNLLGLRQIQKDFPDIAAGVSGLTQIVKGLGEAGQVNQGLFDDFGKDAVSLFDQMIAKGVPTERALMLLQPVLQTLWEQQDKFGFKTDEATGNLLEMAQQSGFVGGSFRSAADQMVLALMDVKDTLIDIKDAILKMGGITLDPITVPVNYESNGPGPYGEGAEGSPYASMGGYVTASGVQYFARGGRVGGPRGSDTVPAWLTPGEYVVNRGDVSRAGGPAGVRRALNGGGVPTVVINNPTFLSGSPRQAREFVESVEQQLIQNQRMQGRQSVA